MIFRSSSSIAGSSPATPGARVTSPLAVGIRDETGPQPRSVLPWLVAGGLVSAASIVLATRGIHLTEVVDAIESAAPLPLILGIVAILLSYPLLALRWRTISADLQDRLCVVLV
jgi:hypothetical protein